MSADMRPLRRADARVFSSTTLLMHLWPLRDEQWAWPGDGGRIDCEGGLHEGDRPRRLNRAGSLHGTTQRRCSSCNTPARQASGRVSGPPIEHGSKNAISSGQGVLLCFSTRRPLFVRHWKRNVGRGRWLSRSRECHTVLLLSSFPRLAKAEPGTALVRQRLYPRSWSSSLFDSYHSTK